MVNELGKEGSTVITPYRGVADDVRHLKVSGDLGQIIHLRADVREEESIRECVRHSDTVYNLIGRDYETRNFTFNQTHVDSARMLARISREEGVSRFIHVSSLNADPSSKSEFLKSKAHGESAVLEEYPNAVIARPGTMYGWEDRLLQKLGKTDTHQIKRWMTGGYIPMMNGGIREFNPVYVGDVARALHKIMYTDDPYQLYELVGPGRLSYKELARQFCETTRRPFFPISVPYSLYRQVVSLTQNSIIAKTTVHDVDRWLYDDNLVNGSAGFADLGIKPEPLDKMMIRFVRHFRSNQTADQPASAEEMKYWKRTYHSKPSSEI